MRSGPSIGPIRMEKEVAVDDLGERSQDALPAAVSSEVSPSALDSLSDAQLYLTSAGTTQLETMLDSI